MDLLIAVLIFVGFVIIGIIGNLIASELYDRTPLLARWFIEKAARNLSEGQQARYLEEWLAHLDEFAGNFEKVWHAFGIWRGAKIIKIELSTAPIARSRIQKILFAFRAAAARGVPVKQAMLYVAVSILLVFLAKIPGNDFDTVLIASFIFMVVYGGILFSMTVTPLFQNLTDLIRKRRAR